MLGTLGIASLDALARRAVPRAIFDDRPLALPDPLSERDALRRLREIAGENQRFRSFLGLGYSDCIKLRPA